MCCDRALSGRQDVTGLLTISEVRHLTATQSTFMNIWLLARLKSRGSFLNSIRTTFIDGTSVSTYEVYTEFLKSQGMQGRNILEELVG